MLEVCEFKTIWPTSDNGIVVLSPTVTTIGLVSKTAYAHA